MIILYSANCPRCVCLEKKLNDANIKYEICKDAELMLQKGIRLIPVLEVNGKMMGFKEAIKWVNEKVGA